MHHIFLGLSVFVCCSVVPLKSSCRCITSAVLPLLCYFHRLVMRMWHVGTLSDLKTMMIWNYSGSQKKGSCDVYFFIFFLAKQKAWEMWCWWVWNELLFHPVMFWCFDSLRGVDRGQKPVSWPSNGMWNHLWVGYGWEREEQYVFGWRGTGNSTILSRLLSKIMEPSLVKNITDAVHE